MLLKNKQKWMGEKGMKFVPHHPKRFKRFPFGRNGIPLRSFGGSVTNPVTISGEMKSGRGRATNLIKTNIHLINVSTASPIQVTA